MTKSQLIELIAKRQNVTKTLADSVVNGVFRAITDALVKGEGVEIRGFGSFTIRHYEGYQGRNPKTGEPVDVAEKRLAFFKVGKELRELVNTVESDEPLGD